MNYQIFKAEKLVFYKNMTVMKSSAFLIVNL